LPPFDVQDPANNIKRSSETPLPNPIAEHNQRFASRCFLICKRAAEHGLDPEQREEIGRHESSIYRFRFWFFPQDHRFVAEVRHRFEGLCIPPVLNVKISGGAFECVPLRVGGPQEHEAVGVPIRERLKEHGVHDAENGALIENPMDGPF
jgi:hypothetical protein